MFTFRTNCWLCQLPLVAQGRGICSFCLRQLPSMGPLCGRCGLPAAPQTRECGRCVQKPPPWQALVCASDYQPPLSQLLHHFKFSGNTALAVMLAKLILLSWLQQRRAYGLPRPDLILSSPLHPQRLWSRGYNQSELLARPLSHWLSCHYAPNALLRVRKTAVQHRLNHRQRQRNLHQAFRVTQDLSGLKVVLIDDVVTSGSTAAEITHQLQQAGAAMIQVWCLCRTL